MGNARSVKFGAFLLRVYTRVHTPHSGQYCALDRACISHPIHFDIAPSYSPSRGGGGGTSILKVSGTCRWQGYDFAIIAIKTGCLNQPNHWHRVSKLAYLATGTDYSVYHRVAFPPTMFMTGPRSRHRRDASVRAGPVSWPVRLRHNHTFD